jgi:hypothetical protein
MFVNPLIRQPYRKGTGANRFLVDPADALEKNTKGHAVDVDTPDEDPLQDTDHE